MINTTYNLNSTSQTLVQEINATQSSDSINLNFCNITCNNDLNLSLYQDSNGNSIFDSDDLFLIFIKTVVIPARRQALTT